MSSNLNIIIEQANSAILSRDYEFAEKILLNQFKKQKNTPDEYYQLKSLLGKLYVRSGDMKKGLDVYKELNSLNPNNLDILNNMGVIYRRLNMFNESVVILEKARAIDTKNETTLYNLGNTYKQNGDYKHAIQCFTDVLDMKPDDALAYNHLASVYFLCKDYPKALETYKMGLKVDPNHPFLNFNLAELYKEEKLYKEAINSYQTAIKTKPNWYEALTAIADCYVEMEEFEKAIETYKMLIETSGKSEENFTKLANLYEKTHDDINAENFYKKAVSINENFLPAVLGYSDMLKAQKRYFDAYNILINNKDKHPNSKELLLSTAEVCLMLEDYAKAKEILNHLSKEIKGDKEVLKMQGKLYSVLGDTKKAELIFEHLLQLSPSEINMRAELADLYFHNDKYKEAANELIKYLNERPQEISARLKLGKAYEQMQKYDLAKREYNKIIKNDSKNTEALAAIVELNKKEGNTAEAVRLANEIVDIQTDKIQNDDIAGLSRSVQLYEDAVKSYGDDGILNKNLDKLKLPQEELDISPEPDLKDLGEVNFEDDDEITLSESFEDMPDLEMPFDDLMELADDEVFDRGEDEDSLDNLVYVDAPIDDSPDIGAEYDPLELGKPGSNRNRKNDIPEEEFQLQDTSQKEELPAKDAASGTDAVPPQYPPYQPPNEPAPYQPQHQSSLPEPDYPHDFNSEAKSGKPVSAEPDSPVFEDDEIEKNEEIEMEPEFVKEPETGLGSKDSSKPAAESPLGRKSPQASDVPAFDEMDLSAEDEDMDETVFEDDNTFDEAGIFAEGNDIEDDAFLDPAFSAPDSLIPSSFDDDLDASETIDEIVNEASEKPSFSILPHGVKKSPQFEEELDIIESYEIVRLFVYLRDLLDNLPSVELKDFLISNERIQMEYVINKLSGDVGLKRRMILLNVRGALKKTIEPKTSADKTLKDVLGYLRIVASQLPDKGFASACIGKINKLIEQIE
ncbi:tetratricopeptide repeat protein [Treponema sp. OMZ 799]|uniref:tetratricopeptide repeat protein n=1 Tax=Treponema sp. OMZ 799 TaxID=2563668 RepID=UPI0020A58679|nr:tetratricopeptide repeat protein [Treponema sp. OMZ 799]UTC76900.1 tetratricopeptide repeat protein [Treponema sp. OMZ 799]